MLKSFAEMEKTILAKGLIRKIALAGAHDSDALGSVVNARRKGLAQSVLIGQVKRIEELLTQMDEKPSDYEIIQEESEAEICSLACRMAAEGRADIPMKGKVQTSSFIRAVLDKTRGFVPEKGLLSQATVFEYPADGRLMILTDCAINIAPDYSAKVKIINNAVRLARNFGCDVPKVAVLAPVEVVNPDMPATIDAAMLAKAADRGQIAHCLIDGPLAFDNAISLEAAQHKGIESPVAGRADILVVPDLGAGNILTKALTYLAHFKTAGTVCGTTRPVIMTSRTDSSQDKYHSILCAVYQVQA